MIDFEQEFLAWAAEQDGATIHDVDESSHLYFKDTFIGGYAGDTQTFFVNMDRDVALDLIDDWHMIRHC